MFWLLLLLAQAPPAEKQEFKGPPQAGRGYVLFHEQPKGACGTCHALGGRGNAVGPDLKNLARMAPRGIAMAVTASRTMYVQEVKLKSGEKFPGMPGAKTDASLTYFDLSKTPPEKKVVEKSQISSSADNATWKHPPESAGYTSEQLADVIAYIRFASFGDTKGVTPDEVK